MMNNIILNGVNSNTIQGLIIQELPPISKPAIRTEIEEIDGRDGDVITKLGYAAYDKQFSIGLYGNYDINQVISFFNTSGTVIFSNEPDKYYNYQILNEIDFERLVRFRTAIVTMHVQPFKYSATETPQELSGTVVTGEGSNINLKNTTDSGLFTDLQKKGDTFQQTYSGKNKFDKVNTQWYRNNGTQFSNTSNTSDIRIRTNSFEIEGGNTYIVSGIPSGVNLYRVRTYDTYEGTNIDNITPSNNTFSLGTNIKYIHLLFSGTNFTDETNTLMENANIQIELGTQATPYEQYVGGTPSPNPDYPQEIKTVTGDNNVTICGKNIFDGEYESGFYSSSTGEKILSSTSYRNVNPIYIDNSKTYIISQNNDGVRMNVFQYEKDGTFISYSLVNANSTITLDSKAVYINISKGGELNNVQIEASSIITDFEAYEGQTYPINLGNIELCEINGTKDYIYKNNGTWYLHKKIGKKVFDGSENWTYSTSHQVYYADLLGYLKTTGITTINNYFKSVSNTNGSSSSYGRGNNTLELYIGSSTSINRVYLRCDSITSASDFKTWLNTHNLIVYYLLATPTDTEITDSTLLSQLNALGNATTYLGTTNISTSGDGLSPILYVETVAVDDPVLRITNSGNTTAKPIMTLYGTGTINLSLNGEQIFVIDLSSENYITIDVANMEAYYNGILKNRLVTGNYENFALNQGENEITFTGTLYSLTISNYSRWI